MILKPELVYAEFLEHFIDIIEDESNRNDATLVSGCLRCTNVSSFIKPLCADHTYIPLSSVIAAGLVDESGNLLLSKIETGFVFYDKSRVEAGVKQLYLESSSYSDIQKIIVLSACQEAVNRVLNGAFGALTRSTADTANPDLQQKVLSILKNISAEAFRRLKDKVSFKANSTRLAKTSVEALLLERNDFFVLSSKNPGLHFNDIIDEANIAVEPRGLLIKERIKILNELVPCLIKMKQDLTPIALKELEAQVNIIRIYSNILALSLTNSWQVKVQWVAVGEELNVGNKKVTLPYSVSKIMKIIKDKPLNSHVNTLLQIQKVAREHKQDLYSWGRNQIPFFASAPAVSELLSQILAIETAEPAKRDAANKDSASNFDDNDFIKGMFHCLGY